MKHSSFCSLASRILSCLQERLRVHTRCNQDASRPLIKNAERRSLAVLTLLSLTLSACSDRPAEISSSNAAADSSSSSLSWPEFRGEPAVVREAVAGWAQKGQAAIPKLMEGIQEEDAQVRRACREALAKITGQWGWDEGLIWRRSMIDAKAEAAKTGKPIMLLQLFGQFDEEFC